MTKAEDAAKCVAATFENDWALTLLEGDDEKKYWVQVRESQLARRNKGKGRFDMHSNAV